MAELGLYKCTSYLLTFLFGLIWIELYQPELDSLARAKELYDTQSIFFVRQKNAGLLVVGLLVGFLTIAFRYEKWRELKLNNDLKEKELKNGKIED